MKKQNKLYIVLFLLLIILGVLFAMYAGTDDSPGGQLLGLVIAGVGILGVIKYIRFRTSI